MGMFDYSCSGQPAANPYNHSYYSQLAQQSQDSTSKTKTIFHVQGSKHLVTMREDYMLEIGCQRHSLDYWLKHYKSLSRLHGYTLEQREEYLSYIQLAAKLARS